MKTRLSLLTLSLLTLQFCFGQNFRFQPDSGIRMDSATTRNVRLVNDTMFLYYGQDLDTNGTPLGLAIATDAPDFLNFTKVDMNSYPKHNWHVLPTGAHRIYRYDNFAGGVISETSLDGMTGTPDSGLRYTLHASDNGTFGVSTYFNDSTGGVHILYIGDMGGVDNVRHAVSSDSGWTFSFASNDILGDFSGPGGNRSYWDPFAVELPDHSIRVFVINQHGIVAPPFNPTGTLYTFLSTDNGQSFQLERDAGGDSIRLRYDDFTGFTNTSLNDPKAVLLPDGRMRVYINGLIRQPDTTFVWNIISATSAAPLASPEAHSLTGEIGIYPNPVRGRAMLRLPFTVRREATLSIYNATGQRVSTVRGLRGREIDIDTKNLGSGIYFLHLESRGGQVAKGKLMVR